MHEADSIDFDRPMPLFPLANCVLLPHTSIPLHIFEGRYRAMTTDAIDGRGLIAMATFGAKSWRDIYHGNPPLRSIVCVGRILRYNQLPDGRFNLLLNGAVRARIIEECALTETGYRSAYLEPIEHADVLEIDLEEARNAISQRLMHPAMQSLVHMERVTNLLNQELPTTVFVDLAVSVLCHHVEDRYAALAEPCPIQRVTWFRNYLDEVCRCMKIVAKTGNGHNADGLPMN